MLHGVYSHDEIADFVVEVCVGPLSWAVEADCGPWTRLTLIPLRKDRQLTFGDAKRLQLLTIHITVQNNSSLAFFQFPFRYLSRSVY